MKMNTWQLFFSFSILLCIDRGGADKAQKLLNSLDLDEVLAKLEEYDVNDDGQLSDMEVELQQPDIQKYLDRYAELLKAEEEDDDDEKDTGKEESKTGLNAAQNDKTGEQQKADPHRQTETPQQESNVQRDEAKQQKDSITPSSSSSKTHNVREEQEPASAETPAVEDEDDGVEIEVVEDLEFIEEEEKWNSNMTLPAVIVAVLLIVPTLLYVLCSKAKTKRQTSQRQKKGQSK